MVVVVFGPSLEKNDFLGIIHRTKRSQSLAIFDRNRRSQSFLPSLGTVIEGKIASR